MKKIEKKKIPLIVLKSLKAALEGINKEANNHLDTITIIDDDTCFFLAKDIDEKSDFYFKVLDIVPEKKRPLFLKYSFKPQSDMHIEAVQVSAATTDMMEHLKSWIKRVKAFNDIEINDDEKYLNQYKKEFEEYFEIIDEDAESTAFDEQRQIFIYKYLEFLITRLNENKEEDLHEVIGDAKNLQSTIQNKSKKETIRSLGKIWAKLRKKGIKLLSDFLDIAKKEGLKKILYGGLDEASDILNKLV